MSNKRNPPRGAVTIVLAAALTALLAFAALAVDRGYFYVALNELQNSADAGALGGAGRLASPLNVDGSLAWSQAISVAEELAVRNKSASGTEPRVQVIAGYWNAETETFSSSAGSPGVPASAQDFPAIRVISTRSREHNNAVPTLIARLFGFDSSDATAKAISVITGPGFIDQRDLFAFVLSKCLYERYWDYTRSPPGPRLKSDGTPYEFFIPSDAGSSCEQNDTAWTSLGLNNSASAVSSIIRSYNTAEPIESRRFAIGDSLPVSKQSTFTSVIKEIENCSAAPIGDGRCVDLNVAVVDSIPSNARGDARVIQAFSCLKVIEAVHPKYVKVQMASTCPTPPSSGGVGPIFGTVTPPALVRTDD